MIWAPVAAPLIAQALSAAPRGCSHAPPLCRQLCVGCTAHTPPLLRARRRLGCRSAKREARQSCGSAATWRTGEHACTGASGVWALGNANSYTLPLLAVREGCAGLQHSPARAAAQTSWFPAMAEDRAIAAGLRPRPPHMWEWCPRHADDARQRMCVAGRKLVSGRRRAVPVQNPIRRGRRQLTRVGRPGFHACGACRTYCCAHLQLLTLCPCAVHAAPSEGENRLALTTGPALITGVTGVTAG